MTRQRRASHAATTLGTGPARGPALGPALALALLLAAGPATAAAPTLEWEDLYDGGGSYVDEATVALADPDGHLVVGGESHDGVNGSDMLIRKLHRDTQAEIWSVRWPAYDGNDMALTDMAWDGHGDLIVGGYIRGCVG